MRNAFTLTHTLTHSYFFPTHLRAALHYPHSQAMNPVGENRERDYSEGAENPTPDEMWRLTKSPRLGGILNPETQIVRSNHFKGL